MENTGMDTMNMEKKGNAASEIGSQRGLQSFVDDSVEVDADSKIITLSTCYANRDTERYLVQAVLISTEK